jgi:hypothetical protein
MNNEIGGRCRTDGKDKGGGRRTNTHFRVYSLLRTEREEHSKQSGAGSFTLGVKNPFILGY